MSPAREPRDVPDLVHGEPLATIVVTTHDRGELARRALASALAQTRRDIEVVVVDDGSDPPFTTDVVDDRVRVIRVESAGGVCRARNVGLAAARGRWITFLDDDDVLAPEMLERSVAAAEGSALPPPVAANAAVEIVGVDGHVVDTLVPAEQLLRGEDYFLERRGAAGRAANSLVVPTEVLRAIGGFDERHRTYEHHDLGLRLNAVASIQGLPDPLYRMTEHRAPRLSRRADLVALDMARTFAEHADAFGRHPRARARFAGAIAFAHLEAGSWWPAIRWSSRAVAGDPRSRRGWFYLAASLPGPHALAAYRRVCPPESTASTWTLTRRRARKYLRRALNHPRFLVGEPLARVVRATMRRRTRHRSTTTGRGSGLVLCVYRSSNAHVVADLVTQAQAGGWSVRLWALDRAAPQLASYTVGTGPGAKFPLLNDLARGVDLRGVDWVVVADDDVSFGRGSITDLVSVAELAELDLVQPAHVERSHREHELTVRRPLSVARRTTFVEIGPVFAVRQPWIDEVVPFPPQHSMGWGLELEWADLERRGARLGIVDAVAVRHLSPVGRGYAKDEQRSKLRSLLDARGLRSIHDIQRVRATWRPWHAQPPWGRSPPPCPTRISTADQ